MAKKYFALRSDLIKSPASPNSVLDGFPHIDNLFQLFVHLSKRKSDKETCIARIYTEKDILKTQWYSYRQVIDLSNRFGAALLTIAPVPFGDANLVSKETKLKLDPNGDCCCPRVTICEPSSDPAIGGNMTQTSLAALRKWQSLGVFVSMSYRWEIMLSLLGASAHGISLILLDHTLDFPSMINIMVSTQVKTILVDDRFLDNFLIYIQKNNCDLGPYLKRFIAVNNVPRRIKLEFKNKYEIRICSWQTLMDYVRTVFIKTASYGNSRVATVSFSRSIYPGNTGIYNDLETNMPLLKPTHGHGIVLTQRNYLAGVSSLIPLFHKYHSNDQVESNMSESSSHIQYSETMEVLDPPVKELDPHEEEDVSENFQNHCGPSEKLLYTLPEPNLEIPPVYYSYLPLTYPLDVLCWFTTLYYYGKICLSSCDGETINALVDDRRYDDTIFTFFKKEIRLCQATFIIMYPPLAFLLLHQVLLNYIYSSPINFVKKLQLRKLEALLNKDYRDSKTVNIRQSRYRDVFGHQLRFCLCSTEISIKALQALHYIYHMPLAVFWGNAHTCGAAAFQWLGANESLAKFRNFEDLMPGTEIDCPDSSELIVQEPLQIRGPTICPAEFVVSKGAQSNIKSVTAWCTPVVPVSFTFEKSQLTLIPNISYGPETCLTDQFLVAGVSTKKYKDKWQIIISNTCLINYNKNSKKVIRKIQQIIDENASESRDFILIDQIKSKYN